MNLTAQNLTVSINGKTLVSQLNMDVEPGDLICMLGTNGVGKSLTLHTLAGLREPASGNILIGDQPLQSLSRRDIAKSLGLLLQIHEDAFPLTVQESALLGRYPHMGLWQWPGNDDLEIVTRALRAFDLAGLEDRPLVNLSGGERERVALATLMVQDPAFWLLDEPLNHLDPQHQLEVLRLLRNRAQEGRAVLASVHNPGLAMRFADKALLLYGDGEWEFGRIKDVLEPDRMERLYNTPFKHFSNGDQVTLLPV